ncbi:MAG TPA: Crp/Fnr family transcriptional regulator [Armatimonadota bacterium]|jgi:CRP/FNR family cyclic AMP-dependent transcriptional regulator|nr:Crp/Fnr family transcriptional regulator [Armatimonadota bacterium]HOJ20871.1 Crp/Fnr family transcriptional regulator [Armatimonadota bacterium]HOM80364.1 Crp/Fnr family transcriptional regulator [Armatimonadota bacterium]HOQ30271.1 Crp/Fnr family transcriptional regulator [Armatimonadota bacterium]HPO72483.1 Crp/Fnr family transcriptional regulator [Armatimonadota bacterium]
MLNISTEMLQRHGRLFEAGQAIFAEGERGDEMYLIHEGKVRIHRRMGGRETTLAVLPPGECFGEMALIDDGPRSASATALTRTQLVVIARSTFETLVSTNSSIFLGLLRKLSERLRRANRQIQVLLMRNDTARVAATLLLLTGEGNPGHEGIVLDRKATMETLEFMTGVSEKEIERVFDTLQNAAIARMAKREIVVLSSQGLEHFVDYLERRDRLGA